MLAVRVAVGCGLIVIVLDVEIVVTFVVAESVTVTKYDVGLVVIIINEFEDAEVVVIRVLVPPGAPLYQL